MKKIVLRGKAFIKKLFSFSKRQEFVIVTVILTFAMVGTQLVTDTLRFDMLIGLAAMTYVLSAFVLREDLKGWEFITLLTLPSFYTAAVFLFYFLLPSRWIIRLPVAAIYAVGMYAILLTENIYNVASSRTIQLLRAAHTIGFLITLGAVFFLIDTVLSLHLPYYDNVFLGMVIILPLTLQALWSMELLPTISKMVWLATFVITAIICQFLFIFSFWPARTLMESLLIMALFYTLVGMTQQYLIGRLFVKTAREFMGVLVVVFLLILLTTRWGSGT